MTKIGGAINSDRISPRDVSIDTSLGVYTISVVEKVRVKNRPRGCCYLACYTYGIIRCTYRIHLMLVVLLIIYQVYIYIYIPGYITPVARHHPCGIVWQHMGIHHCGT